MNQQITQTHIGIAGIRSKQRFAKIQEKSASRGMLTEKLPTLMSRTVERRIAVIGIIFQSLEKRGVKAINIIRSRCIDKLPIVIFQLIRQLNHAIQFGQPFR